MSQVLIENKRRRIGPSAGLRKLIGASHARRLASDPPGTLTLRETVLAQGQASQTNNFRWEDYAQTAVDPDDDRTIWYVGDYIKKGDSNYSTRIGAFRLAATSAASDRRKRRL